MAWWKRRQDSSESNGDEQADEPNNRRAKEQWGFFIADSRPIPVAEIRDIETAVAPGRRDDFVAIIKRGQSTSYLTSDVVCLAAVIDIPGQQLASWPRFQGELRDPHPYMWEDALYEPPPAEGLVHPGLSHDSRIVLAAQGSSGVTYRRSEAEMIEKYLLKPDEVRAVRAELEAAGLAIWGAPTVFEAVAALTVAELVPLFERLPVKKSWTKTRKLEVLFAEVPEDELRQFVLDLNADAFDEVLNIRFTNEVDQGFHRAWARLVGHYIDFCGYRDRDWNELDQYRAAGLADSPDVRVEPHDGCARCHSAARQINANDKSSWPPFHLGCRCHVVTHI